MRFLLINQTFYPDVMATGQYLAEVAAALAERGHDVTVLTSRRAYDRPDQLFPKEETWRGVRIVRVGSTGLGKTSKWRRALDFGSFLVSCAARLVLLGRFDAIVALTSPPLVSVLGVLAAKFQRARFYYWVMDLNPDEAIAAGWLKADSSAGKVLERMSRFSLKRATKVIALDRFMRERIADKGVPREDIAVLPPWAQNGDISFDSSGRNRFRKAHGLEGKFVVMYSGNHSPCHPLQTLLKVSEELAHDPEIVFCFVGGGSEWRKLSDSLEASKEGGVLARRSNICCVPYQPFSELPGSLSAADLHVVILGEGFRGVVHPCKIYNVLAVGAPVLYIGPGPSHVTEIFSSATTACSRAGEFESRCRGVEMEMASHSAENTGAPALERAPGAEETSKDLMPEDEAALPEKIIARFYGSARHGDVKQVIEFIQSVRGNIEELDRSAIQQIAAPFSREVLLPKLIQLLEGGSASGRSDRGETPSPRMAGALRRHF